MEVDSGERRRREGRRWWDSVSQLSPLTAFIFLVCLVPRFLSLSLSFSLLKHTHYTHAHTRACTHTLTLLTQREVHTNKRVRSLASVISDPNVLCTLIFPSHSVPQLSHSLCGHAGPTSSLHERHNMHRIAK